MQRIKLIIHNVEDVRDLYAETSKLSCDMDIGSGNTFYDAKSMLGLLNLRFGDAQYLNIYSDDTSIIDKFKRWQIQ